MSFDPTIRAPAVAGLFYPDDPADLRQLVAGYLEDAGAERAPARAAIVPHAGLRYSGRCAAAVFARLEIPGVVVIVGPNHRGILGAPGGASVWERGGFATALGTVPVATEFAARLVAASDLVAHDPAAHALEHAIEVELPFLATLAPGAAIVPVLVAWDDWERCERLAAALAGAARSWDGRVLLVASSDMTHYEPAAHAERKDRVALEAIERVDGKGLLAACRRNGITMCGRAAAATVLETARLLGAARAELVDYRHSGIVTGDDSSVVGYAGVVVP